MRRTGIKIPRQKREKKATPTGDIWLSVYNVRQLNLLSVILEELSWRTKKRLVLIILDGWGYREDSSANAIYHANTPVLDKLKANYPNMLINTSGMAVGLPEGQMGNSEVGHVNLGAGRTVYQILPVSPKP